MDDNRTIQACGFLLELSPDWLILRASENTHAFLGEYHQRLVGEPLAEFTLAQPLHDLRNSLARQRGSSGTARAYRIRLLDEPRYFDIAFHATDSAVLLEGLPSADVGFGEWLGSVSRLIEGLRRDERDKMLEDAARRMRALTGYDRVTLTLGDHKVVSTRGKTPELTVTDGLPAMVADCSGRPVRLFPHDVDEGIDGALLRAPTQAQIEQMQAAGIASSLSVPIVRDGQRIGHFHCANRSALPPSFELHAAAELFAQMFGMLLPD